MTTLRSHDTFRLLKSVWAIALAATLGGAFSSETLAATSHPLDGLEPAEYEATLEILKAAGHTDDSSLFQLIDLAEPDKSFVKAWKSGEAIPRASFSVIKQGPRVFEAVVDLSNRKVANWREMRGVQPGVLLDEWGLAQEVTTKDPRWQAAMKARGVTDFEKIFCLPLTQGYFGTEEEKGKRLMKVPCTDLRGAKNNMFARPIGGLTALVDLNEAKVIRLIESEPVPIPANTHNYDEESVGKLRPPLNPVAISAPKGHNFTVEGSVVRWQNWSFHFRMDKRKGLVVSDVKYSDQGRERSILYQGSIAALFVPYMDPGEDWYWRTFMDAGEYGFGLLASPLAKGSDCPADAAYLGAVVQLLGDGNPVPLENVICLFERNAGNPVWRHAEALNETHESRPKVDLVLRMISTVGNYDYIFDWVFTQAGEIVVNIGATGINITKGAHSHGAGHPRAAEETAYGLLVADQLVSPFHDHFFSVRLDLDVDGQDNSFIRDKVVMKKLPAGSPRTSIWVVEPTVAKTENQAKARISMEKPEAWRVVSTTEKNGLGYQTGYVLEPQGNIISLLSSDDFPQQRAGFTDYHIWVTPYDPAERHAAGDYVNQSTGGDGLPAFTSGNRSIENTDIVLWYTVGFRHITVAEDWPVLPTKWQSFMLRPFNFFDRNPALDLRSVVTEGG